MQVASHSHSPPRAPAVSRRAERRLVAGTGGGVVRPTVRPTSLSLASPLAQRRESTYRSTDRIDRSNRSNRPIESSRSNRSDRPTSCVPRARRRSGTLAGAREARTRSIAARCTSTACRSLRWGKGGGGAATGGWGGATEPRRAAPREASRHRPLGGFETALAYPSGARAHARVRTKKTTRGEAWSDRRGSTSAQHHDDPLPECGSSRACPPLAVRRAPRDRSLAPPPPLARFAVARGRGLARSRVCFDRSDHGVELNDSGRVYRHTIERVLINGVSAEPPYFGLFPLGASVPVVLRVRCFCLFVSSHTWLPGGWRHRIPVGSSSRCKTASVALLCHLQSPLAGLLDPVYGGGVAAPSGARACRGDRGRRRVPTTQR